MTMLGLKWYIALPDKGIKKVVMKLIYFLVFVAVCMPPVKPAE